MTAYLIPTATHQSHTDSTPSTRPLVDPTPPSTRSFLTSYGATFDMGQAKKVDEQDYVWVWNYTRHEYTKLAKIADPRTRYHAQPESPLCDHAGCAGDCLRRPHICLHRDCKRNCVLTPSMRLERQQISRERIRAYNDYDVTDPDMCAVIQEATFTTPKRIPYGEYLKIMEKGEKRVALLYVDSKRGGDASYYFDLTLAHMRVLVANYKWDNEKRRFVVVANEKMRYAEYLEKKRKFRNWKSVVLQVRDEFDRDGCDVYWKDKFDEVVWDSMVEMEEWRYMQSWLF